MAKEVNKRVNVWLNQQGIENTLKSIKAAINKTANELNKLPIGSEEWLNKSKKLSELKTIYADARKEIGATEHELKSLGDQLDKNIINAGALGSAFTAASAVLNRFIASTQDYVDAYATIDDAMSAVQKTTGMTREEVELLKGSLQSIDTRTSTEQLLKIAEIGGRMGIAKEQIQGFTEAVNKATVALGDSFQGGAEEISSILGKISLAFKETRDQDIGQAITQIGSALNEVGASANATEGNIAAFVQRVGSMPEVFRPTVEQAIALGAAFEESSIDAEVASRAFGIVMMKASTNVEGFATAMHRPVEEIEELINTNPAQFFVEFAESLNGLKGTEVGAVLKDLKMNADGVEKIIGAMSTKTERFTEILNTSNTAFAEAISLDNEYAVVNENAAAQLEKAKKGVQDAKAALGKELLPVVTKLTEMSASSIRVLGEAVKWMLEHKNLIKMLATAYGLLYAAHMKEVVAKKLSTAWTKAEMAGESAGTVVTSLFALAKAKLAKNTLAAANAQKALKVAFAATPWGAIIVAVTTLATGIGMLISKHREAKKAAEEFNTECAREQAEAEYLFDKLKKAEKGTKDYEDALQELKEKYPEIIQKHLDEEGALRDVEQAYKDVIVQIKAKIAEQLKEQKITDATTTLIDEQTKQMERLQKQLKKDGRSDSEIADIQATIREYANSGKSMKELSDKLLKDFNYYFSPDAGTDQRNPVKKFLAAQADYDTAKRGLDQMFDGFIEDGKKASDEIAQIDAQIAELEKQRYGENRKEIQKQIEDLKKLKQQKLDIAKAGSGTDPDKPTPPGSGDGGTNKTKKDPIADFEKKLQEFRTRQQRETMDGWEKTKQTVIDSYQKMIDEAEELNLTDRVKELEDERVAAIAAAGQKYLEKYGKTLEDFSQKFQAWQKEVAPEGKNEMVDAVIGTRQKWIQRTNEVSAQMSELLDLREQFVKDNVDTTSLDALINKLGNELNGMADLEAKDIQKTLEKYQAQTDDFIKAEQKSITDATLTETQRQKNAIEEKYRLEIEHIEKTIAARIAAYGEDDPEVKQLREKIQLLNQLKNQQLANVSSGQKTIWQQLAEFDWSKISDNWQDALDLMSQGLQEFANIAFDIYGSIAQIQDNMMEAELQRTQEAYEAKAAALQRQLNQGVISQKAYDAKMQKLTEEKEKKEKKLKHEQFAREKAADVIQALINGALAITNIWAQWAGQPIVAAVLTAVAAATNAVQIAAIATQPNPYAKGGYIRGRQYAVMGEQGDEWVASNKLLRDKEAATVIAALDDYQKGNRNALANISFATPDPKIMSQAVSGNGRTFAPSNQTTNNYYQNSDNSELLKEMRQMNDFLRDPNNRRAYISRKIQLEFDEQEEEIRSMARL